MNPVVSYLFTIKSSSTHKANGKALVGADTRCRYSAVQQILLHTEFGSAFGVRCEAPGEGWDAVKRWQPLVHSRDAVAMANTGAQVSQRSHAAHSEIECHAMYR